MRPVTGSTSLGERLEGFFDTRIPLDAWNLDAVDAHLRMNVQVRDKKGALVDQDRDATTAARPRWWRNASARKA
jgi:hypothetical protein